MTDILQKQDYYISKKRLIFKKKHTITFVSAEQEQIIGFGKSDQAR